MEIIRGGSFLLGAFEGGGLIRDGGLLSNLILVRVRIKEIK